MMIYAFSVGPQTAPLAPHDMVFSLTSISHIEFFLSASPSACNISSSAVCARVQKGAFWCLCRERIQFIVPRATPGRRQRP